MMNLDLLVQVFLLTSAFWLVTYVLHSTLLIALIWAVTRRIVQHDGLREVLWKSAMFSGIISALVQTALSPSIQNAWQMASANDGVRVFQRIQTEEFLSAAVLTVEPIIMTLPSDAIRFETVWIAPLASLPLAGWVAACIVIWCGGAAWRLLRLFLAYRSLEVELLTRKPITDGPLFDLLQQLQIAARYRSYIRLSYTPLLSSPVALPGNEICVPLRVLTELDRRQQQALLAHELAHIVRRDPDWQIVMQVLECILCVQPLNQFALRNLQSSTEILCDDRAIMWTGQPRALANCLVTVATWMVTMRSEPALTALSAHGRPFLQRVNRLLEQPATTPTVGNLFSCLIPALLLCLILGLPTVPATWFTDASQPADATVLFSAAPVDVRMPADTTDTVLSSEDIRQHVFVLRRTAPQP